MTVQGSVPISSHFMPKNDSTQPDSWHVLIIGLPLTEDAFELGAGLTLRRLLRPLSTFDLAAAGRLDSGSGLCLSRSPLQQPLKLFRQPARPRCLATTRLISAGLLL